MSDEPVRAPDGAPDDLVDNTLERQEAMARTLEARVHLLEQMAIAHGILTPEQLDQLRDTPT